jgi:hypothetical protein
MKKNVAGQKIGAQMVSATDGSAFTGAVTVFVTLDAGTQATGSVGSGACTHEGNGYHTYAPAQAETNGDLAAFTFTGTGAVPATLQVYTSFPQTGDAFAFGAPPTVAAIADGVWDEAIAGHVGAGSTGEALDAASAGADPAAIADAVWDEAIAGHGTAGSTGEALTAAGGAGDPWITPLPGAYALGTAGQIIGELLADMSAEITNYGALQPTVPGRTLDVSATGGAGLDWSNVEAQTTIVNLTNTSIGTVLGNVNGSVGSVLAGGITITSLDAAALNAIADALLNRDFGSVLDTNSRTPLNALRFLRNRWEVIAGVLSVMKEDDATPAWSGNTTGSAGADPITAVDPT